MGNAIEPIFGGSKQQQTQEAAQKFTQFLPEDIAAIRGQQGNVAAQTGAFSDFANQLAGSGLGYLGNLQTQFGSNAPDQTSLQNISQEIQRQKAGLGAQQRQNLQTFRNNPAVAQILNSQLAGQQQLAQNPLAFQASQEQAAREIGLGQAQNQANLQGIQALGSILGLSGQGLSAQNQLLQSLASLGQQFGTQQTYGSSNTLQESGGLLGQILPEQLRAKNLIGNVFKNPVNAAIPGTGVIKGAKA